jgi:hypothetical protein
MFERHVPSPAAMLDDLVWPVRQFMTSKRPPREPMRPFVAGRRLLTATVILFTIPAAAAAETFDAIYRATLAGIPIGKARLTGGVGPSTYTMRLNGEVSIPGFSNRFDASSNGTSRDARLMPLDYRLSTEGRSARTIAVSFAGNRAAHISIDPQPDAADQQERLPIELPHLVGVLDPLSAMMSQILRASQSDNPCDGIMRVFSGNTRFDLTPVSSDPVLEEIVCRATYRPIAGHKPSATSTGRSPLIVIAYPKLVSDGALRLPIRLEFPLSLGTIVIRRVS